MAPGYADARKDPCAQLPGASTPMEKQILDFLRHRDWTDTAEVRRGVGAARTHEVNPTLYLLEKQGKVQKDAASQQPRWKLLESTPLVLDRLLGGFQLSICR